MPLHDIVDVAEYVPVLMDPVLGSIEPIRKGPGGMEQLVRRFNMKSGQIYLELYTYVHATISYELVRGAVFGSLPVRHKVVHAYTKWLSELAALYSNMINGLRPIPNPD